MRIGWGSCMEPSTHLWTLSQASRKRWSLDAFFWLGDYIYSGTTYATNWYPGALQWDDADEAAASTLENITSMYDRSTANLGMKAIKRVCPFYFMWDDHEMPTNDWDHSLETASIGAWTIANQAELDGKWATFSVGAEPYFALNPANTDAEAVAEKPPSADPATDVNNYPPRYFRLTIEDTEMFVLDCISHRDELATAASSSKTMLGTAQKAWLKARLLASTAPYKLIFTPKKTYPNTDVSGTGTPGADNTDCWFAHNSGNTGYEDERAELLDFIQSNSITTVVWLTGDRHDTQVQALYKPGDAYDHVCVNASPTGQKTNITGAVGDLNTDWFWPGAQNTSAEGQIFGYAASHPTHLELALVDRYGVKIWSKSVVKGTNYLADYSIPVAI